MRIHLRDFFTFLPLAASVVMAALGSAFRQTHPETPNYDSSVFGGMLGAISFLFGFHIALFERRRPARYAKSWHRFVVALILWVAGMAAMMWNISNAAPAK